MRFLLFCLMALSLCLAPPSVHAEGLTSADVELTLPPAIYAAPQVEINLYFQNVVLHEPASELTFEVECEVGQASADRWTIQPDQATAGSYPLELTVRDDSGTEIASARTTVQITPAHDVDTDDSVRLLIVGDSLTQASAYPNRLSHLFSQPAHPAITFLGTHTPTSVAPDVAHEGYGGWTWNSFLTRHIPAEKSDGTYRTRSSPFLRLDAEGKPLLDVPHYIETHCAGEPPEVVLFFLGINDCFRANPEKPDEQIDAVLAQADRLLSEFHKAAPEAVLGICLTPPANSRDEAFQANYKDRYPRRGWKQIQHRLVQRYLRHFADRESEQIHIVPTEINIDCTAGYPPNNAVHPNKAGYEQLGDTIYAWLLFELSR